MNERLRPIIVRPGSSLREAMEKIDNGVRNDPPAPWGIALVMDENNSLLGIATDGDIRRAILQGKTLDDPIGDVMTKNPLGIRHAANPSQMLAELHEKIRERGGSESKYHNVLVFDENNVLADVVTPYELWRRSEVKIKTVAVVGLGYVGLTLALTLNEFGIKVIGVDMNEDVIEKLRMGIPHFHEKGLPELLQKHVNRNLILSTSLRDNESDIFVICVGTPVDDNGKVIESYLNIAVTEAGRALKPHDLVILRSTVPIGTCRNSVVPALEKESGLSAETDFFVAFAPERTVEGKALEELHALPQVIGGYNKQSFIYASQFFQVFTSTIVSAGSLEGAEAVKLLNNVFRDLSFSFANEAAQICNKFGLNAREVIHAANEGYARNPIPSPSPGVGGTCLVKDPHIYAESARRGGYKAKLPLAARAINESMIGLVVEKVDQFINRKCIDPKTAKIFIIGIAFKGVPETSDVRYSTSVDILRELRQTYPHIAIYDPVAHRTELEQLGADVIPDFRQGFRGAHCVLVLNNHPSYKEFEIFSLARSMNNPGMVFDPWGMFRKEQLQGVEHVEYVGL